MEARLRLALDTCIAEVMVAANAAAQETVYILKALKSWVPSVHALLYQGP